MISTRNIITSIKDIPVTWVYEHYLKLDIKLTGQEVCINSPLTTNDYYPSFTLFFQKAQYYLWTDFSTGKGGDCYDLVKELDPKLKTKSEAIQKVIKDYSTYLLTGAAPEQRQLKGTTKYQVNDYALRTWNQNDQNYWGKYHIRFETLDFLNAAPLLFFTMAKEEDGKNKEIKITRDLCYGYFTKTGDLYKIYQPGNAAKFLKIKAWVQGDDQIKVPADNLLITKSLKDIAGFKELGIPNWDVISPDSENSLLDSQYVKMRKNTHKRMVTLFDNDNPGQAASQKYQEMFGVPALGFNMGEKDLTDSMEKHGIEKVKQSLIQLLK